MTSMPEAGSPAPGFTLPDQNGDDHSLEDYRGEWVLLYFYPKDDTPGCTKEACGIRDRWDDFRSAGVRVLGVSTDPVESHAEFAEKYGLPFPLLADVDREAVTRYGAWGKKVVFGNETEGVHRISFLLDPDGTVARAYENVRPAEHAGEVLADVEELKEGA